MWSRKKTALAIVVHEQAVSISHINHIIIILLMIITTTIIFIINIIHYVYNKRK